MKVRIAGLAALGGMVTLFTLAAPASAQVQGKAEQKCLAAMSSGAAGAAKAALGDQATCLALAAKEAELPGGSASACALADPKGKVAKALGKVEAADGKFCGAQPDFGYAGSDAAGGAGLGAGRNLAADLFGADLGAAVVSCAADKAACACQGSVLKAVASSATLGSKTFQGCVKAALAAGADSAAALEDCVEDAGLPGSLAADTKGKLAKKGGKLEALVAARCQAPSLDTDALFPGACVGRNTGPEFAACAQERVRCRLCQLANEAVGLAADCDTFDDGDDDSGCPAYSGSNFFSIGAGRWIQAEPGSLELTASGDFPPSPLNRFELVVDDANRTLIRSVKNGKYLRATTVGEAALADADDEGSATAWAIFTSDGDPSYLLILRDGPFVLTVEALRFDGGTGTVRLAQENILALLDPGAVDFQFDLEP